MLTFNLIQSLRCASQALALWLIKQFSCPHSELAGSMAVVWGFERISVFLLSIVFILQSSALVITRWVPPTFPLQLLLPFLSLLPSFDKHTLVVFHFLPTYFFRLPAYHIAHVYFIFSFCCYLPPCMYKYEQFVYTWLWDSFMYLWTSTVQVRNSICV